MASSSIETKTKTLPPQHQDRRPGIESEMKPAPKAVDREYKASGKLLGKVAIITGGDSGIGRAAAVCFAAEGAKVVIVYRNEHDDAQTTKKLLEEQNGECLLISGDIGEEAFCRDIVKQTVEKFGQLDIVVNNAGEQHPQESIADITQEQLERTFRTNIFAMFYLTKAALPHLKEGATIINTASITAYRGNPSLLDYSSTKGAIVSFTRSLAIQLAEKGIRVNGVAPGPVWTPLIPSTFDAEKVSEFGSDNPMKRPGQPEELGPAYVYLASDDSSFMSGQFLHINGGEIING